MYDGENLYLKPPKVEPKDKVNKSEASLGNFLNNKVSLV